MNPLRRTLARIFTITLLTSLAATACGSTTPSGVSGTTTTSPPDAPDTTVVVDLDGVVLVSALVPFTACEDLLTHLQAEAMARVGPYGLDGGGWYGPVWPQNVDLRTDMVEEADMAPTAGMTAYSSAAGDGATMEEGVDYSGTNVQELGIDEPDLIKTDGHRILIVEDGTLHFVDVSGDVAVLTDSIRLDGHWSSDIIVDGDRAFVLASTESSYGRYDDGDEAGVSTEESVEDSPAFSSLVPDGYWKQLTSVIEIDLADPSNLTVANTLTVEGRYVSARVVDDALRVVVTNPMDQLPFVYPQNEAGEERAEQFNREIIAETTVGDWLPSYVHETADGTVTEGLVADCPAVHHPTEFAGFSTLTVLTVGTGSTLGTPEATSVLADGQTVYAGGTNLYVATTKYVDPVDDEDVWAEWDRDYATSIHRFDVSDPASTAYVASGAVPGHLLNQFSMSEHDGHLRVASTLGGPWGFRDDAESLVTVLAVDGDELAQVGQVGDMGKGEQIFAVRFVGDVAYVVTFRQTDPFYTVDLSDPTNPVVRGELKITGYSGYLHPISDDLVLGVGQEATEEGRTTGVKVTLFDVSDLDNPVDVATWDPAGGGSSSVEWDHRAFLWWEPENLAVIPFNDWSSDSRGAVALRIDNGTLTEVGRIDHEDDDGSEPVPPCPLVDLEEYGSVLEDIEMMWGETPTMILCDADGPYPEMDGYWCEVASEQDIEYYGEEFGLDAVELPEGKSIGICFPDGWDWVPPIERTLVIGDDLWSYSQGRLQANSLADLVRLQVVEF